MKMLVLVLAFAGLICLSACQSDPAASSSSNTVSARGTPLGNTGVRVSGDLETGGAVRTH